MNEDSVIQHQLLFSHTARYRDYIKRKFSTELACSSRFTNELLL